jgi:predicted molibdopterin-dependent oxidoreductase YjgC
VESLKQSNNTDCIHVTNNMSSGMVQITVTNNIETQFMTYRVATQKVVCTYCVSQVAQSVQCLTTDWTVGVRSPTEAEDFSSNLCVQRAHPASYNGYGGLFPRG